VARDEFLATWSRIRDQGFALEEEEHELNVRCVGAPIFNRRGRVVAALSVASPADRMDTDTAMGHHGPLLLATTATISRQLGYGGAAAGGAQGA
jgi:DNA-binding IclR family transcriptional regulator